MLELRFTLSRSRCGKAQTSKCHLFFSLSGTLRAQHHRTRDRPPRRQCRRPERSPLALSRPWPSPCLACRSECDQLSAETMASLVSSNKLAHAANGMQPPCMKTDTSKGCKIVGDSAPFHQFICQKFFVTSFMSPAFVLGTFAQNPQTLLRSVLRSLYDRTTVDLGKKQGYFHGQVDGKDQEPLCLRINVGKSRPAGSAGSVRSAGSIRQRKHRTSPSQTLNRSGRAPKDTEVR